MKGDRGSARIADRVRDLRVRATLSQQALADYADISKRTIERIEGGTENPTLFMLIQIATALGMTASELIVGFSADDLPDGKQPHAAAPPTEDEVRAASRRTG